MKLRVLLSLLFVMAVAGCKAPQKPAITDDTIVTSRGEWHHADAPSRCYPSGGVHSSE